MLVNTLIYKVKIGKLNWIYFHVSWTPQIYFALHEMKRNEICIKRNPWKLKAVSQTVLGLLGCDIKKMGKEKKSFFAVVRR